MELLSCRETGLDLVILTSQTDTLPLFILRVSGVCCNQITGIITWPTNQMRLDNVTIWLGRAELHYSSLTQGSAAA